MTGHDECAQYIKRWMAAEGFEVNVSDRRPGMTMPTVPVGRLEELAMTCPHGIPMWMEPTLEQRLAWLEEECG